MTHDPSRGRTTLSNYLAVLRRRWAIVLATMITVPVVAGVVSAIQQPEYQGTAEVYLSRQNLANAINGLPDASQTFDSSNRIGETQAKLARVPILAARTIRATGADLTTDEFLADSSVAIDPNTDILVFHVANQDPRLASRLTTEYAQQFTEYRREIDTSAIQRAEASVQQRLDTLESSGQTDGSLYRELEAKREQLSTLAALQTSNATVVRVSDSAVKIRPKPIRNIAIGLVLGLFLGLALAFLRDALDTRLQSPDEIAEGLGLPLLGLIPAPPRALRDQNQLSMLAEPQGQVAEAVRMLRINLDFRMLEQRSTSVLVTSAVPAEGKSTTSANLAVAAAASGHRVILVDLDLRQSRAHHFFALDKRPGLAEVVLGDVGLDDALHDIPLTTSMNRSVPGTTEGSLSVLTAGHNPPAPGEFVSSARVEAVLDECRTRADLVIIDSPPILRVGDAMVLSQWVDDLLLVAHLQLVRRPMLKEMRRLLESSAARPLGFVVTGLGSAERYGYGYWYGYGTESASPQPSVDPAKETQV